MNFQQKLASWPKDKIWKEYCGYLDLPMDSYMYIQNRLMKEQMERWKKSELGKKLLGDRNPSTIDEFRNLMPLTDRKSVV